MTATLDQVPASDVDLFSGEHLEDPYPDYTLIRDAGPVVHLSRFGVAALARYQQVREAAENWQTFSSAEGISLNDGLNQAIIGHAVVATDPPYHDALRAVLNSRLAPRQIKKTSGDIVTRAEELADQLVQRGSFDALIDCAHEFVPQFVLDRFGFPEEGSEHLLEWADQIFNCFAPPDNKKAQESVPGLEGMFGWLSTTCTRDRVKPGGFADALYEAGERGDIKPESVVTMMSQYAIPGIDTTLGLIGSAFYLFATNPDQWDLVREDPEERMRPALTEALRMETPVQWFARVLTQDYQTEGVTVPAGTRVMLLYAAANRDERKYPDPDRFDVARDPMDHVAFGAGVHGCPGQHMALMQAGSLMTAFARRVRRFELAGQPRRSLNNATRLFVNLPVSVVT